MLCGFVQAQQEKTNQIVDFNKAEQPPIFPGCDNEDSRKCTLTNIAKFLQKEFDKYVFINENYY